MSQVKDSALPSGTTPLAGTETVAIVQGGQNRKVSAQAIADLAVTAMTVAQTALTSYTFALGDAGAKRQFTAGTAISAVVPKNSDVAFPIGATIIGQASGDGAVTVSGDSGVTINALDDKVTTSGKHAQFILTQDQTDVWSLSGPLS